MFLDEMIDEEMAIKEGPQYLIFYMQSHLFAFRAELIAEIVELPEITKVPWMQSYIKGVCNIRGSVVGVVDIAKYLIQRDFIPSQKSSLVIININTDCVVHKVGVIVDEVFEVDVFEKELFQDAPNFGLPIDSRYIEGIVHFNGVFIPVLAIGEVINIDVLGKRAEL